MLDGATPGEQWHAACTARTRTSFTGTDMLVRCAGPSPPHLLDVAPDTLVADRFVRTTGVGWIDLATGAAVSLRVRPMHMASPARGELCAALFALWHPHVLTPIDYGPIGHDWRVEAWPICRPRVSASDQRSACAIRAALSFLRCHGLAAGRAGWSRVGESGGRVVLVPDGDARVRAEGREAQNAAQVAAREAVLRPWKRPLHLRIVGMQLLERITTRWVTDVLDQAAAGETRAVCVRVQAGAGVSTFVRGLAREARTRGYVPVAAALAAERPAIQGALRDRHVLLIDRQDRLMNGDGSRSPHPAADLLLSLRGNCGARSVVLLSLVPDDGQPSEHRNEPRHHASLDPLPAARLAAAASVYPANALTLPEILELARQSAGLPGRFVARLRGDPPLQALRRTPVAWLVRESAAAYTARPPSPLRADLVGLRARVSRGAALARAGRHAAAERVLRAAAAAFERRAREDEAASATLGVADLLIRRGRIREADAELRKLDRYQDPIVRVQAAVARASIRTDDARLADAEHAARAARLAASQYRYLEPEYDAVLALARCLFWQGRFGEAGEALLSGSAMTPVQCVRGHTRLARVELARLNLPAAGRAAAAALAGAEGTADPQMLSGARAAHALVLAAIGDVGGFRNEIQAALDATRCAHSPLLSLRVRLAVTEGRVRLGLATEAGLAAGRLRRWLTRPLPPLLRGRVLQALAATGDRKAADEIARFVRATGARGVSAPLREGRHMDGLQELSDVLHICHEAQDELVALGRVCAVLRERLRAIAVSAVCEGERLLANAGPLASQPSGIGTRAMESGLLIGPGLSVGGVEAAAPVRYGGRPIGALISRWPIDAQVDAQKSSAILAAAGAACAPSMQAALDRLAVPVATRASDAPVLIGSSSAIEAVREAVRRAANAPFGVLIEGESGSGKELVARLIHMQSPRRHWRLCAINCAALTDDLLEAELFGHARGAFTGAVAERPGLFEEADRGTLLLDEVSELSPRAQAKLLRAIQDGEIRRVGENLPRRVDVRLVAATNRPLDQEVAGGRFRADLRYRLDVIRLVVPPLRERPEDIPTLAVHFWEHAIRRTGSRATLDPATLAALARYDWPGNVRELQNVMAALAVQAGPRGRMGPRALPECIARIPEATGPATLDEARVSFERRFVRAALARAGGHRGRAARLLGISRQGLAKLLRRLDIEPAPAASETVRIAR